MEDKILILTNQSRVEKEEKEKVLNRFKEKEKDLVEEYSGKYKILQGKIDKLEAKHLELSRNNVRLKSENEEILKKLKIEIENTKAINEHFRDRKGELYGKINIAKNDLVERKRNFNFNETRK